MGNYLRRFRDALERGQRFVAHDVWQFGRPGEENPSGIIIKQIRVTILLVRGLMEETLLLRASALTFATLLFIVPFLAFMFSFIQTFNLGEQIYGLMSQKLDERLAQVVETVRGLGPEAGETPEEAPSAEVTAPDGGAVTKNGESLAGAEGNEDTAAAELSEEERRTRNEAEKQRVNAQLREDLIGLVFPSWNTEEAGYADPVSLLVEAAEKGATNPQALGISAVIYVLATVLGLMRNVEWSFNKIWGVSRSRNFFRTLSDYLMITLLLPFVAAGILGITAALENEQIATMLGSFSAVLRGGQVAVICLTFSLLYVLVPNTRVQLKYALLGGLVAGVLWSLASWGYVSFQLRLIRNYELFFSTFALFPLLLLWLYTSWIILLFGALVTFAYQNEKTFALERLADRASYAYREALAIRAVVEITRRFQKGLPPYAVAEAAEAWNVPTRLLNETMDCLVNAKMLSACASEPVTYQPARSPETTRILDVIRALRDQGDDPSMLRKDEAYLPMYEGLHEGDAAYIKKTVAALSAELDEGDAKTAGDAASVSA